MKSYQYRNAPKTSCSTLAYPNANPRLLPPTIAANAKRIVARDKPC